MKKQHHISVMPTGHGHWKITSEYRGKERSVTTTRSVDIDDYQSDDTARRNRGYRALRSILANQK